MFQVSKPTVTQAKKGISRIIGVFVVASFGYLALTPDPTSKDALHGAILAGITAIYQLFESTFTTT